MCGNELVHLTLLKELKRIWLAARSINISPLRVKTLILVVTLIEFVERSLKLVPFGIEFCLISI